MDGAMTNRDDKRGPVASRRCRRRLAALSLLAPLLLAAPVHADEYDPNAAGHPLRIVAYVMHPVGVVLDVLIMRPAHWIGSIEPFKTLFGHED